MYSIIISVVIGIATATLMYFLFNIYAGFFMGLFVSMICFVLFVRHFAGKLQGIIITSTKQLESKKFDTAIKTLESGLKLSKWMVMAESQLNGQIGYIYYLKKEYDKAFPFLLGSFSRNWMAQAMLASCYFRKKEYDKMSAVLENAVKFNDKIPMLWGVYGYLEFEAGQTQKALIALSSGVEKNPNDEALKINLSKLQNKKKLDMHKFGEMWYQFWFEDPPRRLMQQAIPNFSAFKRRH